MAYRVLSEHKPDSVTGSTVYFEALMKLMQENPDLVHVDADLGRSILGTNLYKLNEAFPKQVIDCGIQEANVVGVAAGLSVYGKVPFAHSFAPFIARRACDQVFLSCAYNKASVRLVGTDPGVLAAFNGGTHMSFEDIAIMRAVPEMTVVEFSDAVMAAWLLPEAAKFQGNMYIRFARKGTTAIYEPGSTFTLGKANLLREGKDVSIIASGIMVAEALKAADLLAAEGISARVVDMFTIKPIDRGMVTRCARETGAIVTAENHNIIGGLGSAVSDVLCETGFVPLEKVGVADVFGQVGPSGELMEVYHLTADEIVKKAKAAVLRK